MISGNRRGRVYRCPICGAELSVIRGGEGVLAPVCCNTRMELLGRSNTVYRCSICGSELMVIKDGGGKPEPVCCNEKMQVIGGNA